MPQTIDWPPPSRRPRTLLWLLGGIVLAIFAGSQALTYYVETLWFGSLGYRAVFWKVLSLKWGLFGFFSIATFALLYGAFLGLRSLREGASLRRSLVLNGQTVTLNLEPLLGPGALIASLLLAFALGSGMMGEWPAFARFHSAAGSPGGVLEPIFGKPVDFYLLTLPVWELVASWCMTLAVLVLVTALLLLLLDAKPQQTAGGISFERPFTSAVSRWRGLAYALAFLLANLAVRCYLSRLETLGDEHTIFSGVTYVDAHVTLPGLLLVCFALLLGAGIAVFAGMSRKRGTWLAGAALPGVLGYLALQIAGWAVSTFIVKPNELVKEQPFISNNIEFTRRAYGLDEIALRPFSAQTTVAAVDAASNQATLQNIRLWDWHALQDTLRQIQEIRTYYDFPDIDIDRYEIDGQVRQVMLAARELSVEKLPESSRNWINEKLIYTHGYGLTMNPVNGFTPEGLPTLILSNMPVQSTVPTLALTRPEVYFGELTNDDVYVKTGQKEFNYPQGNASSLTSYEGRGGILMGGLLHRVLLALERGDLAKLPFSDDVSRDSRLLMRRNIRERVGALAPFLHFDADPCIVVGEDGRLSWILDAYTTSDTYPYSRHSSLGEQQVNYARNSVKAVVDAYDGTTTFYVFDAKDPILAAYRKTFPSLFQDASAMPPSLRKHIRYPEALLKLQAEAYGLYHMTNPEMFYNREDLWTPATESGADASGERTTGEMEPNYVLMKLPGETGVEFVNILPFTPANRNNLIGWIAGRSDGEHYGSAIVYNFPKTKLVDGPLQVEARIDQNAQISGQLTLWNQQGSHVRRGSLLVIPTGNALLYAESIYLQAERSPMPELRLVVLALQDRLAYGTTFEAALSSLFGGTPSSISATAPSQNTPRAGTRDTTAAAPAPTRSSQIKAAAQDLAEYQRLTSEGKLGEAGGKLEHLKHELDDLSAHPDR